MSRYLVFRTQNKYGIFLLLHKMVRSKKFYVEFITLTVLSLLAANLWIRFVMRLLDNHADSVSVDLLMAVATTGIAFLLMITFFTPSNGEGVIEEPTHREEMYDDE